MAGRIFVPARSIAWSKAAVLGLSAPRWLRLQPPRGGREFQPPNSHKPPALGRRNRLGCPKSRPTRDLNGAGEGT